jgi:hypothetical protein
VKREDVIKKYKGKYIKFTRIYDYGEKCFIYTVQRAYDEIHEDTTLAEDLETEYEYLR